MLPGEKSLAEHDPELFDVIEKERARQYRGLEMIASENFTSRSVMECLGSVLTNKYSEGEVGARYYGGNEYIDMVEGLAKKRALAAFNLDPKEWGVNVQPYSGSPANFGTYTGLLKPHDRIMGLDLPCGGHLTHGFYTAKKKVSATSIYFESMPYHTKSDGVIDYDELEATAKVFRPKLIITGGSAYPRDIEYERVRALCDSISCLMMCDMSHVAGLVAAGQQKNPFEFCDVVTSTTHKTLRGPRSGMVFYRKIGRDGKPTTFETDINQAVFPGLQGGPHQHQIAAVATQMKEVASPEFREYAANVRANCKALCDELTKRGFTMATGGSDNHLALLDFRPFGITGSKMEKVFDAICISTNKNTVAGDTNALAPSGVRIGTAALTTRGLKTTDMATVADFYQEATAIATKIHKELAATSPQVKLRDFDEAVHRSDEIKALCKRVQEFAVKFRIPGYPTEMRYKDGLPE